MGEFLLRVIIFTIFFFLGMFSVDVYKEWKKRRDKESD